MTNPTTPVLVPLPDRGVFSLSGEERIGFLNGLVSNDMQNLSETASIYATFLTPQGKFLFEFIAFGGTDAVLIETEQARIDDFRRKLRLYKLRSKIAIGEADPHCHVLALVGDGASSCLGLETNPGATRHIAGVDGLAITAMTDPRDPALGARLIVRADRPDRPEAEIAALLADQFGVEMGLRTVYDRCRIERGIPDASRDMIVEKSALLESNIDRLNGISWDKGCYMGQELTARTHYRGLVKRRLVPMRVVNGTAPPDYGAEITKDGSVVGDVRSTAEDLVLASVKLSALESADAAQLKAGDAVLEPLAPR